MVKIKKPDPQPHDEPQGITIRIPSKAALALMTAVVGFGWNKVEAYFDNQAGNTIQEGSYKLLAYRLEEAFGAIDELDESCADAHDQIDALFELGNDLASHHRKVAAPQRVVEPPPDFEAEAMPGDVELMSGMVGTAAPAEPVDEYEGAALPAFNTIQQHAVTGELDKIIHKGARKRKGKR